MEFGVGCGDEKVIFAPLPSLGMTRAAAAYEFCHLLKFAIVGLSLGVKHCLTTSLCKESTREYLRV